jgi:hypothetical protein
MSKNLCDKALQYPVTSDLFDAAWELKPQPEELDMFLRCFEYLWIEFKRDNMMPKGWDIACEALREQSYLGNYKPKDSPAVIATYGRAPALNRFGTAHGRRTARKALAPRAKVRKVLRENGTRRRASKW